MAAAIRGRPRMLPHRSAVRCRSSSTAGRRRGRRLRRSSVVAAPLARRTPQVHAPQIASYRMDVRLDPVAKTVSGTERITYRNPSQDTLTELWLRLYLRAFRDRNTIWMRESGGGNRGFAIS